MGTRHITGLMIAVILFTGLGAKKSPLEDCRECYGSSTGGNSCDNSRPLRRIYTVLLPEEAPAQFEVCYFEHDKNGKPKRTKRQFHCPAAALFMSAASRDSVRWHSCNEQTYYVIFPDWPFTEDPPPGGIEVKARGYSNFYMLRPNLKNPGQAYKKFEFHYSTSPAPAGKQPARQAPPYVGADG